eukprot:390437_1
MAVSALFYGQSTEAPFGDTILAIYASIFSSIPVLTLRYMFLYSRPKEKKEFHEWESKLLAKQLIELRKQNYYRNKKKKKKKNKKKCTKTKIKTRKKLKKEP